MRIIAVDVGTGTQDVLLYDSNCVAENNVKLVMPSQTAIVANRIKSVTAQGRSLFLYGETMGGGPSSGAVRAHVQAGCPVYATPLAAKTLSDDLDKVRSWGVKITAVPPEPDCVRIEMKDVDVPALRSALQQFDVSLPTTCAVACQDHGESSGSNRVFRFQHLKRLIRAGGELTSFGYLDGKIPDYLTRLNAVYRTLATGEMKRILVMDTGPAAILGALCDDIAAEHAWEPHIIVNIGNGHTLAAMIDQNRIIGMFEHHTSLIDTDKLDYFLSLFIDGKLTNRRVFDDGGHGCYIHKTGYQEINRAYKERGFWVTVIGPQRQIMKDSRVNPYFAAPSGDMMLAGCFGLVSSFSRLA
ncbi:MAG TPA: DUF1786 domain-containing protein [Candidatus Bathyarchaeia archaeon]|nr:DUF1786 domain-containing protein [Candidatus Bathyarchaeia archaeon]